MSISLDEVRQVRAEADLIYSREQVEATLDRLAKEITTRYSHCNPLVACVMNGGLVLAGCLLPRLDFPLELDYLHATRYRGKTTGGELNWQVKLQHSLKDRHVLIVDDILDEGYTLAAIEDYCKKAGVQSVESVVLVEKKHDRKQGIQASFVGLQTEDRYLFGYGMDYKGYLRNAPGIFAVKDM